MFKKLKTGFKWLLSLVCLLTMLLIGVKLAQQNQDLVQLNLLFWQVPEASTGEVFGVTLLLGIMLGILAALPSYLAQRFRIQALNRKIRKMETQPNPVSLPKVD